MGILANQRLLAILLATTGFLVVTLLFSFAPLQAKDGATQTDEAEAAHAEAGLEHWEPIQRVLTHPRCLNCHQADQPLQKEGVPHKPEVYRGMVNLGDVGMNCYACHSEHGNNPNSGVPGAHHWQLAPLSMSWQGLSSRELCETLKDKSKNGGRDEAALIKHMGTDKLVLWGWEPGADREPVSVPYDTFMQHLNDWFAAGAPCPAE